MWHNNRIRTYTLIFRGWYATVTLYCIVPFHGTDPRPTLSKSAVPPLDEKGICVVQLRIELRPSALQADAQTTTPLHQSEAKGFQTLYLVSKNSANTPTDPRQWLKHCLFSFTRRVLQSYQHAGNIRSYSWIQTNGFTLLQRVALDHSAI